MLSYNSFTKKAFIYSDNYYLTFFLFLLGKLLTNTSFFDHGSLLKNLMIENQC